MNKKYNHTLMGINTHWVGGVLIAILALPGCSGGPSEVDIEHLITAEIEQANKMVDMMGSMGKKYKTEIVSFTNHGCKKHASMDHAYNCDVEITAKTEKTGEKTNRSQLSLALSEKGEWYLMK